MPIGAAVVRRPPRSVRDQRISLAVGCRYGQLGDQSRRPGVGVLHLHPHHVRAGLHERGNIHQAPVALADAARHRHGLPVQVKRHAAIRHHQQFRLGYFGAVRNLQLAHELALPLWNIGKGVPAKPNPFRAIKRSRDRFRLAHFIITNPLSPPFLLVQQPHRPYRRLAPIRSLPILVPNPHLPMTHLPRSQRPSPIDDGRRVVAGDFAAVPKIPLLMRQRRLRVRHQHLPGRLSLIALLRRHLPGQARRRFINAGRIDAVLAAERNGRERRGPRSARPAAQGRQKCKY